MDEIRPQPQSPALGALARMLGAARDAAGRVRIDSQLLGQTSLADLLSLPGAAGLAEDVSYFGPAAMLRPGSGRTLQTFKLDPRVLDAADVALNVSPLGALAAKGAARAARPVARAAGEAVNRAMLTGEGPLAKALAPVAPMPVVKPKGGNWLAGSIESAVEPLKPRVNTYQETPQVLEKYGLTSEQLLEIPRAERLKMYEEFLTPENRAALATERWLDTKLAKYIKNEMATPEDPLRRLIQERGISHVPEETLLEAQAIEPMSVGRAREAAGFPEEGFAQREHAERGWPLGAEEDRTRMAAGWEALADEAIGTYRAGSRMFSDPELPVVQENPWLTKVPPETPVYSTGPMSVVDLDFRHLVDELRNALDPATDLPRELRLQPKDLDKITVPDAVERVAKINAWRAEQKAAADLARANNAASVEYRAYQTVPGTDLPNEKGLRWVELRAPSNESMPLEERKALIARLRAEGGDPETWPRKQLEAALKYEGDTMGHCVGGYCPEVISGEKRIFSLRDAKGEPHVTIEVAPSRDPSITFSEARARAAEEGLATNDDELTARADEIIRSTLGPPDIIQIKGKQNRAPKDDYLPFVQDFVKSSDWGRVGDPQNAGLRKFTDVFSSAELRKLQSVDAELPASGWLTGEDIQRLHNLIVPEGQRLKYDARGRIVGDERQQGFARGGPVRRYAEGGAVNAAQYDPADIARRAASLMEEIDAA